MIWLGIIGLILAICFGMVLLFGAPYLPTLSAQITTSLRLLNLTPGQTLLELGCGDGRILLAAARQQLNVVGYELNPVLVLIARIRTWRYRRQVRVIWGNFWVHKWPPVDGIFTFLLPKYMAKLDKKITLYSHKPIKLVSFAFKVPGRQFKAQSNGLYLYDYTE